MVGKPYIGKSEMSLARHSVPTPKLKTLKTMTSEGMGMESHKLSIYDWLESPYEDSQVLIFLRGNTGINASIESIQLMCPGAWVLGKNVKTDLRCSNLKFKGKGGFTRETNFYMQFAYHSVVDNWIICESNIRFLSNVSLDSIHWNQLSADNCRIWSGNTAVLRQYGILSNKYADNRQGRLFLQGKDVNIFPLEISTPDYNGYKKDILFQKSFESGQRFVHV